MHVAERWLRYRLCTINVTCVRLCHTWNCLGRIVTSLQFSIGLPWPFLASLTFSEASLKIAKFWMFCPGFQANPSLSLAWNRMILVQLHVVKYWPLGLRCSEDPFCQPLSKWIQYLLAGKIDRATHSQRHRQTVSCYRQTARHIDCQKDRQSDT